MIVLATSFLLGSNGFENIAKANLADYNKVNGDDLTRDNWNALDEDFVMKEGDTLNGNLNMDGHRVTNVVGPSNNSDIANVNFVNSSLVASQGGEVYINWGAASCAAPDITLYNGYGFGSDKSFTSGGVNSICLQLPIDASASAAGALISDNLFPVVTTYNFSTYFGIPPGISPYTYVRCAACFRVNSSCVKVFGTTNCSIPSFSHKAYDGFVMGGDLPGWYYRSSEAECINRNLAGATGPADGAMIYGSRIRDLYGLSGYNINSYIQCAVCCN